MTRLAVVFLILLRFAVGWHFFYEGFLKYRATELIGATANNRPFSSAGYFRAATGPLGDVWRRVAGDPDQEALARLVVEPLDDKQDPATQKPYERMPPGLARDWESYVERFKDHYELDEQQQAQADVKLRQAETKMVEFLTYQAPAKAEDQLKDVKYPTYTTEVTRVFPSGELKRRMTMGQRIDEYQSKLAGLRDAQRRMWLLWKDTEGARLRADKAEIAALRAGLLKDVDEQTQELKKSLTGLLTDEQMKFGGIPEPKPVWWLGRIDEATIYGLMAIGVCLMAGLCTRTSAWLGALFLVMTYLAVPPWPWLSAPAMSEGNYLFVNKNVIELLALCVLGTTATGRWCGLDGILYLVWCGIRRKPPMR